MKNWARPLTLIFAVIGLASGFVRLVSYPTPVPVLRVTVDVAILGYLRLPHVKGAFRGLSGSLSSSLKWKCLEVRLGHCVILESGVLVPGWLTTRRRLFTLKPSVAR
jgi:hypothetical protein